MQYRTTFKRSARLPRLTRLSRVVSACLALAGLAAAPAWSLDLRQAYEAARDNDATIRAARAGAESRRELLPQARAQRLPNVSLSLGRNHNDLTSKTRNMLNQPVTQENDYYSGRILELDGGLDAMQAMVSIR